MMVEKGAKTGFIKTTLKTTGIKCSVLINVCILSQSPYTMIVSTRCRVYIATWLFPSPTLAAVSTPSNYDA